jgi:ADP-ribose pyrophosphatase YjhB (NUDIX family)
VLQAAASATPASEAYSEQAEEDSPNVGSAAVDGGLRLNVNEETHVAPKARTGQFASGRKVLKMTDVLGGRPIQPILPLSDQTTAEESPQQSPSKVGSEASKERTFKFASHAQKTASGSSGKAALNANVNARREKASHVQDEPQPQEHAQSSEAAEQDAEADEEKDLQLEARIDISTFTAFRDLDPSLVSFFDDLCNHDPRLTRTQMCQSGIILQDGQRRPFEKATAGVVLAQEMTRSDKTLRLLFVRSKYTSDFSRLPYAIAGIDNWEPRYIVSREEKKFFEEDRAAVFRLYSMLPNMKRKAMTMDEFAQRFKESSPQLKRRLIANQNVKYPVSLPMGRKEIGETYAVCAERELEEEAAVRLNEKLEEIYRLVSTSPKGTTLKAYIVLFFGVLKKEDMPDSQWKTSSEETEMAFFSSLDDLDDNFKKHKGRYTNRLKEVLVELRKLEQGLVELVKEKSFGQA